MFKLRLTIGMDTWAATNISLIGVIWQLLSFINNQRYQTVTLISYLDALLPAELGDSEQQSAAAVFHWRS